MRCFLINKEAIILNINALIGLCAVLMLTALPLGMGLENAVSDRVTINLTIDPAIGMKDKTAYGRVVAPGDNLTFSYSVQNKGYTKLKDLRVVDSVFGTIKMPFKTLIPMQKTTGSFQYVVPAVNKKTVITHNVTATALVGGNPNNESPKIALEVIVQNHNVPSSCPYAR